MTSQAPVIRSGGGSSGAGAHSVVVSLRRWARTIIRARMRSPRRIRSRCSAVYATDDPVGDAGMLFDGLFRSVTRVMLLQVGVGGGSGPGSTDVPASPERPTSSLGTWESERYPLEGTTRV